MQFFPKVFFQKLVSLGMVALVPYNVMTKIVAGGWVGRSDKRDCVFISRSISRLLKISLDIETGIETFRIVVLISRLVRDF